MRKKIPERKTLTELALGKKPVSKKELGEGNEEPCT